MKPLLLFFTLFSISIFSQNNPQWLRHSAISPDGTQIAFTYKGNLYKVNSNGGTAQQLTYHNAHDYKAVWSKDGSKIASVSKRYGNFDVYAMNSIGGKATRLTFHSNDEHPYSFSANDKDVVFGALRQDAADHRQYPNASQSELYSVPVISGRVSQVLTIPAEYVQYSKDGKSMLYQDKKGGENEWRKHHTSSITRDIWMLNTETNKHTMITSYIAEDRQPIFSEDEKSIYYLSERSGIFNVHKRSLENTNEDQQLTSFI
jgi:Tol biopolymer transport system component